ncbi:uncharacterized protein EDB91DRAFT_1087115, partial [Suillus paluster]|uniref:uncharacterized protein n=1 Tax=Suillus paluster TaxID=48578 RepID=UPI001B861C3E
VAFEPLQLQSARAQRSDGHKNRDHKILTTPIVELLGTSLTLDRVRFAVHAIKRLLAFESSIRQHHFKPLIDTIGAVLLSHSYLARTCAVSLDSGYVRKPHSSESFQALTRHDRCGSPLTSNLARISPVPAPFPSIPDTFESPIRQNHFKPLLDTIGAVLLSHSYLARTCAVSLDSGYVRKPHSSESFQALTRHDRCGSPLTLVSRPYLRRFPLLWIHKKALIRLVVTIPSAHRACSQALTRHDRCGSPLTLVSRPYLRRFPRFRIRSKAPFVRIISSPYSTRSVRFSSHTRISPVPAPFPSIMDTLESPHSPRRSNTKRTSRLLSSPHSPRRYNTKRTSRLLSSPYPDTIGAVLLSNSYLARTCAVSLDYGYVRKPSFASSFQYHAHIALALSSPYSTRSVRFSSHIPHLPYRFNLNPARGYGYGYGHCNTRAVPVPRTYPYPAPARVYPYPCSSLVP